jgi:hypothetical protein
MADSHTAPSTRYLESALKELNCLSVVQQFPAHIRRS